MAKAIITHDTRHRTVVGGGGGGGGGTGPVGPAGSWSLVFSDDFDGTSLDLTKWSNNWGVEGADQNQVGTYARNVSVSGSQLRLQLANENGTITGASVSTQPNAGFTVQVGMYAEARVYFSGAPDGSQDIYNWPAWWISGKPWPSPGEHDIAEGLGGELTVNYHGITNTANYGTVPGRWGNAFHVYGCHRKASSADVYWDGVLVKSYPTGDNGAGENPIFNVGQSGSRTPVTGSAGAMLVDWVRVWEPAGAVAPSTLLSRVVGVPSTSTGIVNTRTTSAASVRLKVGTNTGVSSGVIFGSSATPDSNGNATLTVSGLSAGTQYYYRVAMTPAGGTEGLDTASTVGSFRTAPSGATSFAVDFGSCSDTTNPPVFTTVGARADDLFLQIGDLYYADGSGTSLSNIRSHMAASISSSNQQSVYATRATVYTPSDHDGMNNNVTAGSDATAWTNWNTAYREFWPVLGGLPGGSTGCYYTFVWGRVRFVVTDTRSFKSNPSATDNSTKTALGTTQKQWVKDTVNAATERMIVIVNADPWIGSASAGDDAWLGYTTERTEMANFYAGTGKKIIMTGGDMHALAASNGTGSPGGVPVFHAAPLYNTASQKGGPYTVGPYPTDSSLVQQYGRIVFTDTGTSITATFTGYSSDNTQRVTLSTSVTG